MLQKALEQLAVQLVEFHHRDRPQLSVRFAKLRSDLQARKYSVQKLAQPLIHVTRGTSFTTSFHGRRASASVTAVAEQTLLRTELGKTSCVLVRPVGINSTQRSGCRAMIRLLRSDDHGWYVARFVETHNHQLSQGCGETRQWNSHNRIDPVARDFIHNIRGNNVSLSRLYGVIGGTLGYGPAAPFTKQSLRGLCARMSQDSIVDDISKTMKLLGEMQGSDPDLSVCIDTEE
ncbi:hypothetical protein EJB05_17195, partial [Eragrostis curvula]